MSRGGPKQRAAGGSEAKLDDSARSRTVLHLEALISLLGAYPSLQTEITKRSVGDPWLNVVNLDSGANTFVLVNGASVNACCGLAIGRVDDLSAAATRLAGLLGAEEHTPQDESQVVG